MPTITDFEEWHETNEIDDDETRDCLVEGVENERSACGFTISSKNGQLFVKGPTSDVTLRLSSAKAKSAFISFLQSLEIEEEDELEAGYRRNMESPHS
ncbi:hypothetical protein [Methylobacterium radiodurans]|uniref:hypothetical protein n=1 Tax=Methylobacterium radiodurans TaxID=2202828 RepID=UPI0013A53DAD|nr:hypothetical protein [Methylobacterium radiodurans]